MIRRKAGTNNKLKIGQRQVVGLEQLDAMLDVTVQRFGSRVSRLVREFKAKNARLDLGLPPDRGDPANLAEPIPATSVVSRMYLADLRRLTGMNRAEEFRMARRYEFLKARVVSELTELGVPGERVAELAKRPHSDVLDAMAEEVDAGDGRRPQARKRRAPNKRELRWLDRCLQDLELLRNRYVEGALYLVLGAVQRYRGLGVDAADLVQEGNASLFQAIEGFDWRRDVRFKTYAQYWVHQAILKLLYNSSRTVRVPVWVQKSLRKIRRFQDQVRRDGQDPTTEEIGEAMGISANKVDRLLSTRRYAVSLDAEIAGEDGSSMVEFLADNQPAVPDSIQEGDLKRSLAEVMEDLPDRESMILRRRFGLDGLQPETLGEIAGDLGITAERVRQLQNAALTRLKKPRKLSALSVFVE